MLRLKGGYILKALKKPQRAGHILLWREICGSHTWQEGCACSSMDKVTVQAEGETIVAKLTHSEYVPWLNRQQRSFKMWRFALLGGSYLAWIGKSCAVACFGP